MRMPTGKRVLVPATTSTQPSARSIIKPYLYNTRRSALSNPVRMPTHRAAVERRVLSMATARQNRVDGIKDMISTWKSARSAIGTPRTGLRTAMKSSYKEISSLASRGMSRAGSFMERALVNKPVGLTALGVAGIGAAALGISYGVASMARASKRPPVIQTAAIRSTGQTNQYFNMGADPFSGVRFASRRRNV